MPKNNKYSAIPPEFSSFQSRKQNFWTSRETKALQSHTQYLFIPSIEIFVFIKPPNPLICPVWAFKGQYQYCGIWLKCSLSSGLNVPLIQSTINFVSQTASNPSYVVEVDHPDCTGSDGVEAVHLAAAEAGWSCPGLTYRSWAGQQSADPAILQLDSHSHAHCSVGQTGQQSI